MRARILQPDAANSAPSPIDCEPDGLRTIQREQRFDETWHGSSSRRAVYCPHFLTHGRLVHRRRVVSSGLGSRSEARFDQAALALLLDKAGAAEDGENAADEHEKAREHYWPAALQPCAACLKPSVGAPAGTQRHGDDRQ